MAHKTLIDGTAYEVSGGKTKVNGTAYGIAGGRTLIGGTGYDIGFEKTVGGLAVGRSVYMNESGSPVEYLVVNQGIPSNSSLYDSSCNGTWLLRKDIYTKMVFDSTDNDYPNSDAHAYLNGTFLGLLDSNIQSVIKQVKIPYHNSTGSVSSGSNGLSAKIFLLSSYEVGVTNSSAHGAKLDYFTSGATTEAKNLRIAKYSGSAAVWWLRSPNGTGGTGHFAISTTGICAAYAATTRSFGIRPALILPSDTCFDENYNIIAQ